jgi:sRNA-binding regulator protein Hfq
MTVELKGPSSNQFKKYITGKTIVEIKVMTGETISGHIKWSDDDAIFIETEAKTSMLIMKNAIIYLYTRCPEGIGESQCNQ